MRLTSGITREKVMRRVEAIIKASRVMFWTETIIERKTGMNNYDDRTENC